MPVGPETQVSERCLPGPQSWHPNLRQETALSFLEEKYHYTRHSPPFCLSSYLPSLSLSLLTWSLEKSFKLSLFPPEVFCSSHLTSSHPWPLVSLEGVLEAQKRNGPARE